MMTGLQVLLVATIMVTALCAWIDFKTGLIPNKITYPFAAVGACAHIVFTAALYPEASRWFILFETISGGFLCALVPLAMWKSKAMGGGDVKLLGALGATLGPTMGLALQLYAFFFAVLLMPIVLAYRGVLMETVKRSIEIATRPFKREKPATLERLANSELRFGPAILAAALVVAVIEWGSG
jgi:prepilin peptidase CpaA